MIEPPVPDTVPNMDNTEIMSSAASLVAKGYGGAAYISDVASELGITVAELAPRLLEMHRETPGGCLRRADLVQAMDGEKVRASEIQHPELRSAVYHFIVPQLEPTYQIPRTVATAVAAARAAGFEGRPVSHRKLGDIAHELYVVECEFGHTVERGTYIVAADTHEGGGAPVLRALGTATHLLQNASEPEVWEIGNRTPPR